MLHQAAATLRQTLSRVLSNTRGRGSSRLRLFLVASALAIGTVLGPAAHAAGPSAGGGCSGSSVLTLELGKSLPLWNDYSNPTDDSVKFVATMHENAIFGPTQDVFGHTLEPHRSVHFSENPVVPIPFTTPVLSDHVVIELFAGSTLIDTCDIQLTIVPPAELQNLVQVPVRMCVIEGSPQAETKKAGQTVSGKKVFELLAKANKLWLEDGHIVFRPAFSVQIPVIADPKPPSGGLDKLGDLNGVQATTEAFSAAAKCEEAWAGMAPDQRGTVVVNARVFTNSGQTLGVAPGAPFILTHAGPRFTDMCAQPRKLLVSDVMGQFVVLVDQSFYTGVTYPSDPERPFLALAHELGHTLLLGHGNGFDDDKDGVQPPAPGLRPFDDECESTWPQEDNFTPFVSCEQSSSLMNTGGTCTQIRPHQVEVARAAAKLVPGATFKAGVDPAGMLVADHHCTTPPCELPPHVFLVKAEIAETPGGETTSFSHTMLGPIPAGASAQYALFADLDSNPLTGCAPASLGFSTSFAGAELATRVVVTHGAGGIVATPTVWSCSGGAFVQESDPDIRAWAYNQSNVEFDDGLLASVATLTVPNDLLGSPITEARVQALAKDAGAGGTLDRIPSAADAGKLVTLEAPTLPVCSVFPPGVRPGEVVTVQASDLIADSPVDLYLGERLVASTQTDASGALDHAFVVPATTDPQLQAITALVRNTAANAACGLLVVGPIATPATTAALSPVPNGNGWNKSDVTVSLNALDIPGGPGIAGVTYSATGAQPLSQVTVTGSSASIPITAEGVTQLSFFATSQSGAGEMPGSAKVMLDKTAPTVVYAGNAGTYGVDEEVHITCTASDAGSGVLTTDCEDIVGPAWSFGLGSLTITSSAEDLAGNVGQGSTSFSVAATYSGLCTLSRAFVSPSALSQAQALCAQLAGAEQAAVLGNERAHDQGITAYQKAVAALLRGDILTEAEAELLTEFANAL